MEEKIPDRAKLGRILRRFRRRSGLSQEELGERAGLHRTYVSQLELGTRNPTFETLTKFLAACHRPWADLGRELSREGD